MANRFGIFAKHWTAGCVKTRLAATVGASTAAELHRLFLTTLLARFQSIADDNVLFFSPSNAAQAFADVAPGWSLHAQAEGDLGARMHDFFCRGFQSGAEKVLLIGSDSPSLPTRLVKQAMGALDDRPVVLGPSEDGGYYLVGARQKTPPIFDDIDWGGAEVFRQTAAQLDLARIHFTTLPRWFDVDRVDDLKRLQTELEGVDDEHLARLSVSIRAVVQLVDGTRTEQI